MTLDVTRRTVLKAIGAGGILAGSGVASARAGPETLFTYDPSAGELPENIAIDRRGTKYVSMPPRGEIRTITPDNRTQSTLTTFDVGSGIGVLGLEADPTGRLFACLVTFGTAGGDTHGVWSVGPKGTRSLYAALPTTSFPNDILLDGRSLLVTDSAGGTVWRVSPGEATVWSADPLLTGTGALGFGFPLGANGIAAGRDGTVYVANTERGQLVRIPVNPDGSAGAPERLVADPKLFGADGLAIDTRDDLYVAVNAQDTVVRVESDGTIETLATSADGLDAPADVTFGTSRGEQKDVFIANFALFPPDQRPSLMKLDVGVPGRPIHR